MQVMYAVIDGAVRQLTLPEPSEFVLPEIRWGAFDELLTPAYWRGQVWQHLQLGTFDNLRLGHSLIEEVAACLLGGYGMPAALGLAAYHRIREAGILDGLPEAFQIEDVLSEPFQVDGHFRKYRFPRQKARYLSACLVALATFSIPEDDRLFRDHLAQLPGIGPKTASWVVRNLRPSSAVAVIDVHILRAGRFIGLFPYSWEPQRNYRELEGRFVAFAEALEVPTALLDGVMWDHMRRLSPVVFGRVSPSSKQLTMSLTAAG